jgi:hypothetical protein
MCAFWGASFIFGMAQVHEFMLLGFAEGIEAARQLATMEAIGDHLVRCAGLVEREFFRGQDGRWVEHVVWASQADLEASAGTCEDAVVARLFDCFDTRTVTYLCGERIESGVGGSGAAAAVR